MKSWRQYAAALLLGGLLSPLLAAAEPPLRLVTVPWREPDVLQKIYGPTLRLLERKLNRPVQLDIARDYNDVHERLLNKAADLGKFGAASYVEASARSPNLRYLVTAMTPDDHYFSIFFTRQERLYQQLKDLRGVSFGMTDKQSTSGYLIPRRMLSDAGINPDSDLKTYLLKKHPKVAEAVLNGTLEAGAIDSSAWFEAQKRYPDQLREITRSAALPRDPIAAAPHLDDALANKIQQILAAAENDAVYAQESTEIKGYAIRGDRFYDPIRAIWKAPAKQ
jgi:phosphonate transport system substrate-binding protein